MTALESTVISSPIMVMVINNSGSVIPPSRNRVLRTCAFE